METEIDSPDYIEKAETGAIGRVLAMSEYGTLQAHEFDEGERIADDPIEKNDKTSQTLQAVLWEQNYKTAKEDLTK